MRISNFTIELPSGIEHYSHYTLWLLYVQQSAGNMTASFPDRGDTFEWQFYCITLSRVILLYCTFEGIFFPINLCDLRSKNYYT